MFWQILVDGFTISALYALGATGFTLIFGVSGVLNLSHGALMVAAVYAAWVAGANFGVGHYAGAAIGVAVAAGLAMLTYFAVVRPLQNGALNRLHGVLTMIAASIIAWNVSAAPIPDTSLRAAFAVLAGLAVTAFAYFAVVNPLRDFRRIREQEKEIFILTATLLWGIMIQELIAYFYTNNAKTVLPLVEGVVEIAGVRMPANKVFTAVICWLVIGLLWLLVNRTRAGKALLAASMNPRGVTLLGIELSTIYVAVWAIYGVLVGIAGVLLGMFLGVSSYSVGPLTASAFSIVVLGGLGSVSGSLIAAYVVGYLETMTAYLVSPAYRTIPALLLLVFVMYVRPRGLLGRR
jgi:branched-chain amino acid transport system permease protein